MISSNLLARSISEIIKNAGGAIKIAEATGGAVTVDAVYKWPRIGIPDRHWPVVMRLSNATAAEMLAANLKARASSNEARSA